MDCILTVRQMARRAVCPTHDLICSLLVCVYTWCNLPKPYGLFKSKAHICPSLLPHSSLSHSYVCLHGLLRLTCVVWFSSISFFCKKYVWLLSFELLACIHLVSCQMFVRFNDVRSAWDLVHEVSLTSHFHFIF